MITGPLKCLSHDFGQIQLQGKLMHVKLGEDTGGFYEDTDGFYRLQSFNEVGRVMP
jgi:hypothetical protein